MHVPTWAVGVMMTCCSDLRRPAKHGVMSHIIHPTSELTFVDATPVVRRFISNDGILTTVICNDLPTLHHAFWSMHVRRAKQCHESFAP
jgi:hypothetical protein